jgi:hypothetical protein
MAKSAEKRWLLSQRPRRFEVFARKAAFAVVVVVAADGDLAPQVKADLEEMVAGASDLVSVLLLVDLPGEDGAAIVELTPAGIRPLAQEHEISTGDPMVLANFFGRALASYSPATRFALGFWGHGKGVFADDDPNEMLLPAALLKFPMPARPQPTRRRRRTGGVSALGMLPDQTSGGVLTNREAHSALAVAFARAGRTEPVDIIFSDTCLNGSVEVFTELREFAQVVVASSLLIPAGGWNYKFWLQLTGSRAPADARAWAELAVEAFESAHPQVGDFTPAQLAAFSTRDGGDLVKAFGKVVQALSGMKETRRKILGLAANRVQSVQYRENLDLEQLVLRLRDLSEEGSPLRKACRDFLDVFRESLVAISSPPEGGEDLSGLTIWCPIKGDLKGVSRYYRGLEFAKKTKWLKFLRDIEDDKREAEAAEERRGGDP